MLVLLGMGGLSAQAETLAPQIVVPAITSAGTKVEPAEFITHSDLLPLFTGKGDVVTLSKNDREEMPEAVKALIEEGTTGKTASAARQGITPSRSAQAVVNVTPGSSIPTAVNLRNRHVRATFSAQNMGHFYFIDILPTELNSAFSLILGKMQSNS